VWFGSAGRGRTADCRRFAGLRRSTFAGGVKRGYGAIRVGPDGELECLLFPFAVGVLP